MIVIQLSSAYNPGDADPGRLYTHIKINAYHFYPDSQHIQIYPQYGSASLAESGSWTGSSLFLGSRDIAGSEYALVLSSASLPGELPFAASDRVLHQWLLQNYLTGTLMSSSA